MILSHKFKFIFIKTMKTAGTSIEVYLSQHCSEGDVLTPISPQVEPHRPRNYSGIWNPLPELRAHRGRDLLRTCQQLLSRQMYYNHISAVDAQARTSPRIWDEYFKFCVERNPWDKTLSHYSMMRHQEGVELTLDEYFRRGLFCRNSPLYTDRRGRLLVDRVLKYEALDSELKEVFQQLGVPFNGTLRVNAKGEYRADRTAYQQVLTKAQAREVERVFSDEIAMHGYTFARAR